LCLALENIALRQQVAVLSTSRSARRRTSARTATSNSRTVRSTGRILSKDNGAITGDGVPQGMRLVRRVLARWGEADAPQARPNSRGLPTPLGAATFRVMRRQYSIVLLIHLGGCLSVASLEHSSLELDARARQLAELGDGPGAARKANQAVADHEAARRRAQTRGAYWESEVLMQ
jgi:hypothetical protein